MKLTRKEKTVKNAIADYRSCAQTLVERITDQWNLYLAPPLNFWRIANAFTTLIDFFVSTEQDGRDFGQTTHKAFLSKNTPDSDWWYDDYSWWGVAFLQAAQHSDRVGYDEATWRGLAQTCWDKMAPATKVWENADKNIFARAKPRFDGGCWNRYFVPVGEPNACDPLRSTDAWPACGIQNTVTNTQYLVFGARFSQADDAKREYGWLRKWFFDASLSADQKLLASYEGVGMLVRERVSTYAQAADGTYPPALNYDRDRHWTGDQGILLGALLEMVRLDPGGQTEYYFVARTVLDAVRTKLVNAQLLQPWMPAGTIGSDYLTDYATGVGVYMRYLQYVASSNDATLKQYISSEASKSFIQTNADEVCKSIANCPRLPGGSKIEQMECLLNQLAVLNAAIVIVGP
jgi:hypothetical protein